MTLDTEKSLVCKDREFQNSAPTGKKSEIIIVLIQIITIILDKQKKEIIIQGYGWRRKRVGQKGRRKKEKYGLIKRWQNPVNGMRQGE